MKTTGRLQRAMALVSAVGLGAAIACSVNGSGMQVHAQDDAAQAAYYTQKVEPILETNCYRCHGGTNHRGGLNLNTRESMLKGSHHGPAVVPGHPEQSWMVKLIRHEGPADDPMPMPPAPKPKLSDSDVAVIETWIKAGAVMPPATATPAESPSAR